MEETIKVHLIDARMAYVSNYRYPITKSCNWIPVIGHPRDRAPITREIGARRTNQNREFCYRYDYWPNWTPLSPITITNHTNDNIRFVYHEYDYRPFWRHEVFLPINHKNYNFREKKKSQVIKGREILHLKTDKGSVLKPRLWLVDLNYNFECDWLIELSDNKVQFTLWYVPAKQQFFANFQSSQITFPISWWSWTGKTRN